MKFSCGENWEVKKARLSDWHPFFAILPRTIGVDKDGNDICVWLEWIERKGRRVECRVGHKWLWVYRATP